MESGIGGIPSMTRFDEIFVESCADKICAWMIKRIRSLFIIYWSIEVINVAVKIQSFVIAQ